MDIVAVVALVLLTIGIWMPTSINGQCFYSLDMKFGSDYYFTSPSYPSLYSPSTDCMYEVKAPYGYRINLTCEDFRIPSVRSSIVNDKFSLLSMIEPFLSMVDYRKVASNFFGSFFIQHYL